MTRAPRTALWLALVAACGSDATAALDAGTSSGPDSGAHADSSAPQEPATGPNDSDGALVRPYCAVVESDAPDVQRRYVCHHAELALPGFDPVDPKDTPAGAYQCDCDHERVQVEAATSCADALTRGCNVDPYTPVPCEYAAATWCWPKQGASDLWTCQCEDGEQPLDIAASDCRDAALIGCARPCTDARGSCTPLDGEVGYECTCTSGESSRWPGARDCACGLFGCEPMCKGGAGECYARADGFDCVCTGSSESVHVKHADGAGGSCPMGLEIACGFPPRGESCEEADEHGTTSCVADGRGGWDCDCAAQESSGSELPPNTVAAGYSGVCDLQPAQVPLPDRPLTCIDAVFSCSSAP